MRVRALRFDTRGPSDAAPLQRALDSGELRAQDVVCVIGKTEGNGGRNDFTRELAVRAFGEVLGQRLGLSLPEVEDRVVLSFSGGTEGVVTPHAVVFAVEGSPSSEPRTDKRLAIGIGYTRAFAPEEIGRAAQIDETARAIREIAARVHVAPEDVHLLQMKGAIPAYTYEQAAAARQRGVPLRSDMVHSRAASALGAAIATGEVSREAITDDTVCEDWSLFSTTSSCSAKPGLDRTEVVLFGMSDRWDGDLVVDHGVLADILDAAGVRAVAARLGLVEGDPRVVGVFAKAEADARGVVRGHRHTMLTDDDINDTRYARCSLAAVIASTLGDPRVYVSTRAEHHGPLGGGSLAIVARVD